MELINLHTHSDFCGHASSSLEEVVQAAHDAGITVLACTEHFPLNDSFEDAAYTSMPWSSLEPYKEEVRHQRTLHPDMEILLGCELDWLGADEDRSLTPADFEEFDIVLGSVHFLDKWLANSSRYASGWKGADVDALWRQYVDLWCEAAESAMPYTVMAHPDVLKKFGHYPSFDLRECWERMAAAAKAGGRMVEVNTSGMYAPCAEMYPCLELLQAFCRAGVPCTVGTDAHHAAHVARGIVEAYRLMRQAGYSEVTVPLRGGARKTLSLM